MWNIDEIRGQFPALEKPFVFLDNPGGTQISRSALDRIQQYLIHTNANHGGSFLTSRESDATVDLARASMADFINACLPEEIIFGANMTTLTMHVSRSLARLLKPGDTIVVTRLDHDANVSPWLLIAEDHGCHIRWVDINPDDCTLNMEEIKNALEDHPKIVAFGYASNAVGTINPAKKIIEMIHEAGAISYVDAVQYAPHGPIDVTDLNCDFLVCSAYKFFGPHLGILYGRYNLLETLQAYKVRPAPVMPPGKFETGTGNFENISGLLGALEYFQWIGDNFGKDETALSQKYSGRKLTFKKAMAGIQAYEYEINCAMLEILNSFPSLKLYGIADKNRAGERVPTFSFTVGGYSPQTIAERFGKESIFVWDGNFYALPVTERLHLEGKGGLVRAGAVHYNSLDEIHRFGSALKRIIS